MWLERLRQPGFDKREEDVLPFEMLACSTPSASLLSSSSLLTLKEQSTAKQRKLSVSQSGDIMEKADSQVWEDYSCFFKEG